MQLLSLKFKLKVGGVKRVHTYITIFSSTAVAAQRKNTALTTGRNCTQLHRKTTLTHMAQHTISRDQFSQDQLKFSRDQLMHPIWDSNHKLSSIVCCQMLSSRDQWFMKWAQRWKCRCWKLEHSRPQDKDGWGKRRDESRNSLLDSILEQWPLRNNVIQHRTSWLDFIYAHLLQF